MNIQSIIRHSELKDELFKAKSSELAMGIKVEKEHAETIKFIKDYYKKNEKFPPDKEVYKHIASNHLDEFKKYYSELKEMEEKLKNEVKGKAPVESELIAFLKRNPNSTDEEMHAFAKKKKYDIHKLEAMAYRLATKAIKDKES